MADNEALQAEERKIRRLRRTVDLTTALLYQADLTLETAQRLVAACKKAALELFPDKEETFDLVYGPRFRRILTERFGLQ
ncbi:MAG TPA: hypothetical protein VNL14_12350 [Candidatus Acidoferrales bacterium]|nr:hypothetical protein [Candidatus Acidoferrales bacterium]